MNKISLSIIVPVFNARAYLFKAAQSTFKQSFKDFELIFINDGSTDDSLSVLEEIAKQDSRVKVYSQKNKGVTAARKLGWLKSSANYITFLDADDEFSEDALNILMREIEIEDYDILNGSFMGTPSNRLWQHKLTGVFNKMEYLESLLKGKTYGVLYASIYKKELFQDSTFSFDNTIKIGEDVLMNIELCTRAKKIKNIKNIVYRYTDDNSSSAMKIIVRHPSYYFRFNKIRNSLIKAIDYEYFQSINEELSNNDNIVIINSFFSPFIDFNKDDYTIIKELSVSLNRQKVFALCLSNIWITKTIKNIILTLFLLKNKIQRKSYIQQNILY